MRFYALGVLISLVFAGWTFDYQATTSSTEDDRTVQLAPIGHRILNPGELPPPGEIIDDGDEEEPTP